MLFSKTVGLFLSDEQECSLVRAAIEECGLEPADLASRKIREEFAAAALWPRLVVTDEGSAIGPETGGNWSTEALSLVLLVQGADLNSPNPEMASVSESYPWVLRRPLQVESVVENLRKAAHASDVFAKRSHKLLDELHRARRILDSMSNGVTLSDANLPDHPLVYINPAFERMTGYSASESYGRNSRFLQNTDTDQPDLPKIREAIAKQTEVQALVRNYRRDGTPFWNEFYMSPIFDTDGRLTHFVGFQNDVTTRVEAAHQVEHLARHDGLTGLANRGLMMELLKQALPRAQRAGSHVAVLFFDLNNFKYVNDEFGHEAGDQLLRAIAERLQRDSRAGEMVARIGGDEFVAVIEDITAEFQAVEIMERLSSGLAEPYDLDGQEFYPSASIGMAFFPRDGATPESLLKAADVKMYKAKEDFHRAHPVVEVDTADRL